MRLGAVPIVFIHGITGDPSIFTTPGPRGAESLAVQVAAVRDTTVWTFDYHAYSLDWVTNPNIGPAVASAVACLARLSGHRVIVIAHSMGGLATQYAAAQADPAGGKVGDRIAHVFTIGTPFTGSKLLTVLEDAIKGNPVADPTQAAIVDAILSKCAGAGEAAYRKGGESTPCSLLSIPGSPVGTALRYNSQQIRALPRWSRSVPVTDVAGEIRLTFGIWKLRHTFDIGDVPVSQDSATAHNTSGAPIRVVCHDSLVSLSSAECYHGRLPQNPNVVVPLLKAVRSAVALEDVTFLPATSGPNEWSSYLPVIAGRTCTYRATSTVGQFTSVAQQTSVIPSAQLEADGVHFSIRSTTTTTTTGPGTTPQAQSQMLTYFYALANNGTVRVSPGNIAKSGLSFTYSGFEVWPTVAALRQGQSITTTMTARFSATTAALRAELNKALNGQDSIDSTVTFKVGPAPPIGPIVTQAGTFTNTIGVRVVLVSEHEAHAPAGTDAQVIKVAHAFGPGTTDVYFARGIGIVETKQSGLLASLSSPVELTRCAP
jgi:pimeloyl-ACP methyl ester carboxylesterase